MKKFYIVFLITLITITIGTSCFAAQFYDTIGTKYESPTQILYTLGIVDGTSEHIFSANRPVTRAEMAKLIISVYDLKGQIKSLSRPELQFKDIKKDAWYYDSVCIAIDLGMINGYSDGTFRPNDTVTYAEAVAMIIRALGYEVEPIPGESWEEPYIRKTMDLKIAKNAGYFQYDDAATRGNVSIFLWNMLNTETYTVIKDKTYVGIIKDTVPRKVISIYYPDYAIIDDEVLEGISIFNDIGEEDEDIVTYQAAIRNYGFLKVENSIPLKRIGLRVSGLYDIENDQVIGLNFNFDANFDEGTVEELKEHHKMTQRGDAYVLGSSKNYAYIYFDEHEKIDRITYLGSNDNILVKESKIDSEKYKDGDKEIKGPEYILLNDNEKIYTSRMLINEDGEVIEWSSVKEDGVLSELDSGMYVYYDKTIKGQLQNVVSKSSGLFIIVDDVMYKCDDDATYKLYGSETTKLATQKRLKEYIGREIEMKTTYSKEVMEIDLDRNYENSSEIVRFGVVLDEIDSDDEKKKSDATSIRLATIRGKSTYKIVKDSSIKVPEAGTLVNFEMENSRIAFLDVFKDGIRLPGGKVDMDVEEKDYIDEYFGDYEVDKDTVIYMVEKEYAINSDKVVKDYHMRVESDRTVLDNVEDLPVHVLYDEDKIAVAIFIETELNKYEYRYGKVLEVYQHKEGTGKDAKFTLKVRVSPFNNAITDYTVKGSINCEPGDLISYKTDDGNITVNERYSTEVLGDKRDYIVESCNQKVVRLTNGDEIDLKQNTFKLDGKEYEMNRYIPVFCKVSKITGSWKFVSAEIIESHKLDLQKGDRIAIDEIEDTIIIYRGYEE